MLMNKRFIWDPHPRNCSSETWVIHIRFLQIFEGIVLAFAMHSSATVINVHILSLFCQCLHIYSQIQLSGKWQVWSYSSCSCDDSWLAEQLLSEEGLLCLSPCTDAMCPFPFFNKHHCLCPQMTCCLHLAQESLKPQGLPVGLFYCSTVSSDYLYTHMYFRIACDKFQMPMFFFV